MFLAPKAGADLACVADTKGRGGGGREKRAKVWKREGSACFKSRCFCILPTNSLTNLITSTVYKWPITSRGLLSMAQTWLLCLPEIVQSRGCFWNDIILSKIKHYTVLAPTANMTNIDYKRSLFFYCSQSVTNNDQFRVNTQDLWSCLIKHNGHKYYKNNERSIINNCQKTRQTVFTKASALSLQTI